MGDKVRADVKGAKKIGMKAVLVGKPCGKEDWCVEEFKEIGKI